MLEIHEYRRLNISAFSHVNAKCWRHVRNTPAEPCMLPSGGEKRENKRTIMGLAVTRRREEGNQVLFHVSENMQGTRGTCTWTSI